MNLHDAQSYRRRNLYDQEIKLDFDDVLIHPVRSPLASRELVDLASRKLKSILNIDTCGIIAANMDGVGTFEIAKVLKDYGCMTALHKHYDLGELLEFFSTEDATHSFYSMGMTERDAAKLKDFYAAIDKSMFADVPFKICIDVANGYMEKFSDFCAEIHEAYPDAIIMAGNVVDFDGIVNLVGVDPETYRYKNSIRIAKLGIGQGSNCLTRTQTGIGYPQLSCVYDTRLRMNEFPFQYNISSQGREVLLCSDGGCATPGDVAKAFVAGANTVMLGGMLAGTDEGGGDIIEVNGQKFVEFYGMSSLTAQKKHNGGLKEYRSSEGRTTLIPYKGSMKSVITNILGGLRSTCTYTGSENIDDLHRAKFIRVNTVLNRSMEKYTVGV